MSTSDFYWPPYDDNEHLVARAARSAAWLTYSVIAYALFLGTIGYFVLFVAGIAFVPKTVDRGSGPLGPALLVDMLLLLLFGLQHSIMARTSVKRRLVRVVPQALERSTFVLASGLVLLLIFWLWRPIPAMVWYADGTSATVVRAALWGGVILAVASTFVFSHTELFGLQQPVPVPARRPPCGVRLSHPPALPRRAASHAPRHADRALGHTGHDRRTSPLCARHDGVRAAGDTLRGAGSHSCVWRRVLRVPDGGASARPAPEAANDPCAAPSTRLHCVASAGAAATISQADRTSLGSPLKHGFSRTPARAGR